MTKETDTIETLKWNGDFLAIPEFSHASQIEVYENITGILLGLVRFIEPHAIKQDYLRVPLQKTLHWGAIFEGEDNFERQGFAICKYIEFKVENFYFNGGQQKKRCLWIDNSEWQKLLHDRKARYA